MLKRDRATNTQPTVTVRIRLDISDVDPNGDDDREPEELLNTFAREYEQRIGALLPGMQLRFDWRKDAGPDRPEVTCNCEHGYGECLHELDTQAALEMEKPYLDALDDNEQDPRRKDEQQEREHGMSKSTAPVPTEQMANVCLKLREEYKYPHPARPKR